MLKKSLLESESEWNRSNSKPIIDTKMYKGDLSRYMPTKGTFQYIHIDVDGKGGIAKLIEDNKKFGANNALMTIAEGALGHTMFSIR